MMGDPRILSLHPLVLSHLCVLASWSTQVHPVFDSDPCFGDQFAPVFSSPPSICLHATVSVSKLANTAENRPQYSGVSPGIPYALYPCHPSAFLGLCGEEMYGRDVSEFQVDLRMLCD
ncbi:hypothetical protein C8R43DRAFT_273862 [Mycena crocata]|nr:hypothetical protein C8R43DRAFT_273862 [Mycena crocata]